MKRMQRCVRTLFIACHLLNLLGQFLSLRLLNKRGRVRLSTQSIDYSRLPGKSSLLAIGNQKGFLAAAVRTENGNCKYLLTFSSEEFVQF
jgi:hypothetical protein